MLKRCSTGKTKPICSDQRGAILVIMAACVLFFTLLFAGVVEFGRYLIAREQLQTAADAAALASVVADAAVERQVEIQVATDRGEYRY